MEGFAICTKQSLISELHGVSETTNLAQLFAGEVLPVDDSQANLYVGGFMLEWMGLNVPTASGIVPKP